MPIQPREATEEELLKLHNPDMITKLKNTDDLADENALEELSSCYDFIFIHPVRIFNSPVLVFLTLKCFSLAILSEHL